MPRSNGRPAAIRSDVAGRRVLAGRSRGSWLTLIPIPQTTAPPEASSRIPATLRPSTRTSFGHFTSARTPGLALDRRGDREPGDERELRQRRRRRRPQQDGEEQRRRRGVVPASARSARAPPSGARRRRRRRAGGRRRGGRPASTSSRRRRGTARRALRGAAGGRRPARAHSPSSTRRRRFVAPRRFFASRRCSFAARDGRVGTRLRSTRSASASRATSRSIASSRLRAGSARPGRSRAGRARPARSRDASGDRSARSTPRRRTPPRPASRVVFACCPPGPLERETRSSISESGSTTDRVTRRPVRSSAPLMAAPPARS